MHCNSALLMRVAIARVSRYKVVCNASLVYLKYETRVFLQSETRFCRARDEMSPRCCHTIVANVDFISLYRRGLYIYIL